MVSVLTAFAVLPLATDEDADEYVLPVSITSTLPVAHVPLDPLIDFGRAIREAGAAGVLDPNSISVVDRTTGETVPHALGEAFGHGDRGRVRWVVHDPGRRDFEIRFRTAPTRRPPEPIAQTPLIGVGDLLRYNAGVPRPFTPVYPCRMVDLTGDGKPDLVGCWNYGHAAGQPWSGLFCYPRLGNGNELLFGDPVRLRYVEEPGSRAFRHFTSTYLHADLADLNGDGLPDIVCSPRDGDALHIYLNSGERDQAGMPVFVAAGSLPRGGAPWYPCRIVDLDGDGSVDLVVGNTLLRNTNPEGWPMRLAEPVKLEPGLDACFLDVDGDGRLDAVCLLDGRDGDLRARTVGWRRNLGGHPPAFAPAEPIASVDAWWCDALAASTHDGRQELLVVHDIRQQLSVYECRPHRDEAVPFRKRGRAESVGAFLALSDQAWPCVCDWDGDGDLDLLVGGGYGWPRIVINSGTREVPAYEEARQIMAGDGPIRILRDDVLGGTHWHNMGYPYPAFVDWDGDGLPDLVLPNETNRIFWYKNIGTRAEPRFGERRQIVCDGYADSADARAASAGLAADRRVPNSPYPYEKAQPFFWRTGAGFADFNGDGLMDLVTHDGFTRKLTLFAQYRDATGELRLRKHGPLKLADERLIDDSLVGRTRHWTEAFRCVDWDGDGLIDVVYSCAGSDPAKGSLFLLRNCGNRTEPVFEPPVPVLCFGEPIHVTAHGPHPWVGDYTGDGTPDIVTCVEWSVYPFYRHAALVMPERPRVEVGAVRTRGR